MKVMRYRFIIGESERYPKWDNNGDGAGARIYPPIHRPSESKDSAVYNRDLSLPGTNPDIPMRTAITD
jgi:hypothetical protein